MFRRSRFSVRPNVGSAGRTAANPEEAPAAKLLPSETPGDVSGPDAAAATPDGAPGDGNDPSGDGGSASAALQRRKRFSVKPKVAPGRPAPPARAARSPVKPVSDAAVAASAVDKSATSGQAGPAAASVGLGSPRRRRPSEDAGQAAAQPKPTPAPSESSSRSAEKSLKPADAASGSQGREAPPRVPPFIPDKEAIELSEKAKTLVSSKSRLSLSPSALSLSRLLNDPSDLQRLAKAQKLKELLREESHKEKKLKRAKRCVKKFTLDPTKMTMRDLLRYVPQSNPMTSSLETSTQEEETVIPASPGRDERSPERAQQPEVVPKIMSPSHEEDEEADEEQEEALMVPQVKVAADGSLIIDEESLTVEVQRAKGPNPADDRDPIFERGSTTTYSSFRKGTCSKPWCSEETDMFFLAISMVGTDFSMICQLFPHRARAEIKNKFKKEERVNAWRIDKAFRERRRLDIEYFSKLLEKIMEVQKNRKKLKSLAEKPPKKRKAKGKKAARKLSDVDEEDEEDENLPDLDDDDEEGGGKENELLCNEGEDAAAKPKKQRKRKTGADASKEEPREKKSKSGEKSSEQDEFCTPQEAEAALPEDSDISVNAENAGATDSAVQPATLPRGGAPKPRLPLGRKWGRKVPPPSAAANDSGDESGTEATSQQVKEDAPPTKISANEENSSEDDEAPVAPPKPTRYGRIPKPTKPLAYPCKADGHSSASEPTPSSPEQHGPSAAKPKPECTAKRGRSSQPQSDPEPKKPRLVTLRASQSDDSDEENDQQSEEEQNPACSPSKDSTAPAFVPASLRSPQAKISMVEETMEELDILANMPDVLGISQDALCPDASCEQAHNETCDHQLDLLVDVIDFLSSEHTEVVEDESYTEAAQTLLTIGNLYPQNQTGTQAHAPGATSSGEASRQLEDKTPPDSAAREAAAFGDGGAESSTEVIVLMEQQADSGDNAPTLNEQMDSDANPVPRFQSSPESLKKSSPQTEMRNLSTLTLELFQPSGTYCQFESSFEQSNQERGSISSQTGNTSSAAPGISVTEPRTEGGLNTDSVRGQEDSCQSAACTGSCVEDLPVGQEAKSEVASPLQPRRSRLQKVKPNLPRQVPSGGSSLTNKNISEDKFQPSSEQTRPLSVSLSQSPNEQLMSGTAESGSNSGSPEMSSTEPQVEEGLNTHSAQGGGGEDPPASQGPRTEVASPLQPRRSRLQKVKPNLPPTCRAARSKPQVTKTPEERDGSPTPIPQTIAVVEPEPSRVKPPEKPSESTGLEPALKLGTVDNQSIAEEKRTEDATFDQVPSGGSSLANTNISEDKFQPSSEQTRPLSVSLSQSPNEQLMSGTAESGSNSGSLEMSSTEPQVEEGLNTHSAQGGGGEDPPASQGPRTEVASPLQPRRSRLQKVKPNLPSTCRAARSKPQVTKAFKESESSPDLFPKATAEVEPEPGFATPPEKATESAGPVSDSSESQELSSSLTSTGERKSTDDATLGQVESAGGRSSENDLQPTALSGAVSESANEKLTSDADNTDLAVSQKAERPEPSEDVTVQGEAQASSSGTAGSVPSLESSTDVTCKEEPRTQVGFGLDSSSESSEPSVAHRRRRSVKVRPKPNLTSTIKASRSKLLPKGVSNSPDQQHASTSLNVMKEQQSEHNSAAHPEPEPTEKDKNPAPEPLSVNSEPLDSEMEPSLPGTGDKEASCVSAPTQAAEVCSISTAAGPETGSGEKQTGDKMSSSPEVEVEVSSQGCKGDVSTAATEVKTQPPDGCVRVLKKGSTKSETTATKESSRQTLPQSNTQDKSPDAAQQTESREVSRTSNDRSQSAHSTDESQSESSGRSICASKAHPRRRGRLIKPKPNLARSSQPPKGQQAQRDTQAHADSRDVDASVSHKPVSQRRPERKPVEGAAEQESHSDGSVVQLSRLNAESPVGCSTPVPPAQSVSALSSEGSQSLPCLSLFSDLLSEQLPSDPDEPFFILSLTEIPVSSSGEVVDSAAEPLSYLPVADASIPRNSLPGEHVGAAAGVEPLPDVPVLTEESEETSRIDETDSGRLQKESIIKNPADANQERTTVHSPKTGENNNDAEVTPTKPTLRGARRKAKTQVKPTRTKQGSKALAPNPTQTVQPDACDATANATDDVVAVPQTESEDRVEVGKEAAACAQGSSSGAPAGITSTRVARRRTGKPKDSAASSGVPPPGKAVPSRSKVPTPHGAGKPSSTAPRDVAPTPRPTQSPEDARSAPSASTTQTQVEAAPIPEQHSRCPTPATGSSRRTQQVPASGGSDCVQSSSTEEPTSVAQYFLSDIFTDVAEL